MARIIDNMRCPFCGKRDVEYGLALCSGCHADISYDAVERERGTPTDSARMERLDEEVARANRDFDKTIWPFNIFAHKKLEKLVKELEDFTSSMNNSVDRRIARGSTTSIATFTRGGRSIDVTAHIPPTPHAKVDFDVVLIDHNGKKLKTTEAVKNITKLGMRASIKMVEETPSTLLSAVSASEAEAARAMLVAAGATVEVR